ncbi:hypothetical protein BMR07_10185 [Methylococcaceae bacterium CS1]|nr:hypothetical protein BMR11_17675 [Methylococcaceae bacterium CS5]TXK98113.1 hypothetical protein BMR10_03415 [Methylococcaceae bacterium CS4]TXL05299.1 hypothetical protein BMR07_10185 [Methylococcaceae bacterium CS1]TXL07989.1 hypothetical protein BMR09_04240 [Methylococcaceae bacterium CS3]TXL11798.1 hypothetical protein BMR08_02645 [Methylococcaceae bacterium CS2]
MSTVSDLIDYDKTCILKIGEHPFIKHESYILYRKSAILGVTSISRSIGDGSFSTHQPFNDVTFGKCYSDTYDSIDDLMSFLES